MKRLFVITALLAALGAARTETASFVLPVDTTLFMGVEDVHFTGTVHVVTRLAPVDPCAPTDPCKLSVHFNAQHLVGVGLTSGGTYRVAGTDLVQTELTTPLPGGVSIEGKGLRVLTPSPPPIVPPNPVRIELDLAIDAVGVVSVSAANLALDVT